MMKRFVAHEVVHEWPRGSAVIFPKLHHHVVNHVVSCHRTRQDETQVFAALQIGPYPQAHGLLVNPHHI